MATKTRAALAAIESQTSLLADAAAWVQSRRSTGSPESTLKSYANSVRYLDRFLAEKGMPRDTQNVKREHIEGFIQSVLRPPKNSTAYRRDNDLRQFFKWLMAEGIITSNPMANMKRVQVAPFVKVTYPESDLRRLTGHLANDDSFWGMRDLALLRLLITTGLRASELADLAWDRDGYEVLNARTRGSKPSGYVDWENRTLVLLKTKGRTARTVPIKARTWRLLRKYNVKHAERYSTINWLWISTSGKRQDADPQRLTYYGVSQAMKRRCEAAGVEWRGLHAFRHTWVSGELESNMSIVSLGYLAGWSERSTVAMAQRYSRDRVEEIAGQEAIEHNFGDDF